MSNQTEYNVIIIGAGMAGLSAAQHLAELGRTVLILEAKNRVGGRIHTLKTRDNFPIEMGANLLLNPGTTDRPNPLVPLLHQLKLTTQPIDSINSTLFKAGNYFENVTKWIEEAKQFPWTTWPSLGEILKTQNVKFKNKLKLNTAEFIGRQAITHMIEQQTGTSPHYVSLLELMHCNTNFATATESQKALEDTPTAFISGGYQNLPDYMAKKAIKTGKVSILLNMPVQAIHYFHKNHTTRISTLTGEHYTAKSVLCTVPLGVLKKKTIHFFPELSDEKQHLIKHLKIGFYNKVILEFEKVFWPKNAHFLFPGNTNYYHFPEYLNLFHFSNHQMPALACHFYASEACFKDNSDDPIIEKALQPLREAYGKVATDLKDAFISHWESDPYALGSTSCYGLHNKSGELKNFEKPETGGLFFAGAHTLDNQNRETVHGAYISGVRGALDINHYLKTLTHH